MIFATLLFYIFFISVHRSECLFPVVLWAEAERAAEDKHIREAAVRILRDRPEEEPEYIQAGKQADPEAECVPEDKPVLPEAEPEPEP